MSFVSFLSFDDERVGWLLRQTVQLDIGWEMFNFKKIRNCAMLQSLHYTIFFPTKTCNGVKVMIAPTWQTFKNV